MLVAGDPERKHMRKVGEEGGIRYHVNLLRAMVSLRKIETKIKLTMRNIWSTFL